MQFGESGKIPGTEVEEVQEVGKLAWNVGKLKILPAIHALSRTHSYISGVTPQQVVTRISCCCKTESIATKFDPQLARIQAETIDNIGFVVQLFLAKDGKVIVEVEKTKGCSFRYLEIARVVLNAAEGEDTNRTRPASLPSRPLPPMPVPLTNRSLPPVPKEVGIQRMPPMPSRKPLPLLKRSLPPMPNPVKISRAGTDMPSRAVTHNPMQAVPPKKDKLSRVTEDLDFVSKMLQSDRIDTKLIALETLLQVTNSADPECRSLAAKKVLCGPIFDSLVQDMCGKELDGCDILCQIRRNALTVFGNCLEGVGKCDPAVLKERENIFCDKIVTQLVSDIGESSTNPHEACRAAKCLRYLFESSSRAMSMGSLNFNSAVMSACKNGVTTQDHAMLEQELMQLEQVMMKA